MKKFFKNWKTSVGGLLYFAGENHFFGQFSQIAKEVGVLLIGFSGADYANQNGSN